MHRKYNKRLQCRIRNDRQIKIFNRCICQTPIPVGKGDSGISVSLQYVDEVLKPNYFSATGKRKLSGSEKEKRLERRKDHRGWHEISGRIRSTFRHHSGDALIRSNLLRECEILN